jgi:outer membrane biosynthesis protein TonB
MTRRLHLLLIVPVLALGLTGCETFDPTSIFDAEIFNTKKKLPGERQAVFPEGTPGVSQGVPPDLVKGYQPPPEPEPAKPAEAKPKPKPKVVTKPKEEAPPTRVTVRPSAPQAQTQQTQQTQWPDAPAAQRPASASPSQPAGQVAWPDPPAPR